MKKRTLAALIAAPVAIAGIWTAAAASDNNATEAATYAATHPVVAPTPAPTVTTTKTVAVPTVPQSCLDALDNADQGFTYAGQIMDAASNLDSDAMDMYTAKLTALAPTYNANKAACRAIGGN